MRMLRIGSLYTALALLILAFIGCANIDSMLLKGEYGKASVYCSKQKNAKRLECYNKLADAHFEMQSYASAAKCYILAENEAKSKECYVKLAEISVDQFDYDVAIAYYEEAGYTSGESKIKVADACYIKEDYESAAAYFEQAGDIQKAKECYLTLAQDHLSGGDHESAAAYFEQAGDIQKAKECYLTLAQNHLSKGDYGSAGGYYEKAGDMQKARECYNKAADSHISGKDYVDISDYMKAAEYYEKSQNIEKIKECYTEIGDKAVFKNNYEEAAQYYIKAGYTEKEAYLKTADEINRPYLFSGGNNYEEAAQYYIKAGYTEKEAYLKIANQLNTLWGNNYNKNLVVEYYLKAGFSKEEACIKALEKMINRGWYNQAIEFGQKTASYTEEEAKIKIAHICFRNGGYHYLMSSELYKDLGYEEKMKEALKKTAEFCLEEGYYASAAECYEKLGAVEDSKKALELASKNSKFMDYYEKFEQISKNWDSESRLKTFAICIENILFMQNKAFDAYEIGYLKSANDINHYAGIGIACLDAYSLLTDIEAELSEESIFRDCIEKVITLYAEDLDSCFEAYTSKHAAMLPYRQPHLGLAGFTADELHGWLSSSRFEWFFGKGHKMEILGSFMDLLSQYYLLAAINLEERPDKEFLESKKKSTADAIVAVYIEDYGLAWEKYGVAYRTLKQLKESLRTK